MTEKKTNKTEKLLKQLLRQNEFIISLLGRVAIPVDKLKGMVIKKKQNPEKYVECYNACDGHHSVTELAKIAGVKPPTISNVLKNWIELGIIYEVERPGGKFYKKLYSI